MTKSFRRFGLALVIACAGCLGVGLSSSPRSARGDNPSLAAVDQLESQAFAAIKLGQFDKSSELLAKAATLAQDPKVADMARWAGAFEAQQQRFAVEREKQYQKNVADVHTLLDHDMRDYAIDAAQQAYIRAADKKAFRNEAWVDDLVKAAADDAQQAESNEQWLKALRIYSDLTSVDPSVPTWKTKLKLSTRRIRLLMLYTPDQFKALQKSESAARKAADELLRPTTQPATKPVEPPAEDANADFKLDWHDTIRGINFDMLLDALIFAERDYYRDVNFQTLLDGGVNGLRTMVTTKGLDSAFPGLGDPAKRTEFLNALSEASTAAKAAPADAQEVQLRTALETLQEKNRQTVNLPDEVFISEFADGAFAELDPFSSMIWPYDTEDFNKTVHGKFSGVGIQIQSDEAGNLKVVSPLEDSPAQKAGIRADDVITHIDGKNAKGISLNQAVKTITGPTHTNVTLTVRSPDGTVKNYTIERQAINVASVKGYLHKPGGGWDYFCDPENKIAYIRLTNFTEKSGSELTDALDELQSQGAKAVVLDLRYNPGGLLNAAVEVASQFVREGVVVSTHPDRQTENMPTVANAKPDVETTNMPLVVLVNQYSASASEIVSGALKDHGRATIVGERTFGKGSVQMLFPLSNKSAFLKLTTSHYYLPSGRCLHREESSTDWGVNPDVTIEMTPEQMRAAIDARQEMDVLRDVNAAPTTQPAVKKDLLAADPQLSAALLVLRLKLDGAQLPFP